MITQYKIIKKELFVCKCIYNDQEKVFGHLIDQKEQLESHAYVHNIPNSHSYKKDHD